MDRIVNIVVCADLISDLEAWSATVTEQRYATACKRGLTRMEKYRPVNVVRIESESPAAEIRSI